MYTEDHNDRLLCASPAPNRDPTTVLYTWMTGGLDFSPVNPSNWDVAMDIMKSPLWPYCANYAGIFRCPADQSKVRPLLGQYRGLTMPRVRSISMSIWFGGFGGPLVAPVQPGLSSPPWRLYLVTVDLVDPGPARSWLFMDQRADSINWGNSETDIAGYPEQPDLTTFTMDYPVSYHSGAGGLAFADGHTESHRWQDRRTVPPLTHHAQLPSQLTPSPRNQDITWLQERTTRRLN
jgi:prepilin-type processing-associated H-X9-DG protein